MSEAHKNNTVSDTRSFIHLSVKMVDRHNPARQGRYQVLSDDDAIECAASIVECCPQHGVFIGQGVTLEQECGVVAAQDYHSMGSAISAVRPVSAT